MKYPALLMTLAACLWSPFTALAGTATYYYSGASCTPVDVEFDLVARTDGGYYSRDTITTSVICPLTGLASGTLSNTITLVLYDRNQTEDVRCTLRDSNGTTWVTSSDLKSSGYSSSKKSYSYKAGPIMMVPLHLVCDVPRTELGESGINYIKWISQNP